MPKENLETQVTIPDSITGIPSTWRVFWYRETDVIAICAPQDRHGEIASLWLPGASLADLANAIDSLGEARAVLLGEWIAPPAPDDGGGR